MRSGWVRTERGRPSKSEVKGRSPTPGLDWELRDWSVGEAGGIRSVAVQCVDIRRNSSGEGGLLEED